MLRSAVVLEPPPTEEVLAVMEKLGYTNPQTHDLGDGLKRYVLATAMTHTHLVKRAHALNVELYTRGYTAVFRIHFTLGQTPYQLITEVQHGEKA